MRLGILSDSHDRLERTLRALEILKVAGAETLVHCGDLTGPEIVQACGCLPCAYVFGNNDYRQKELRLAIEATGGQNLERGGILSLGSKRIVVTHGHLNGEFRRLLGESPDYLLFGHTHIPYDVREGSVRRINPGALHRAPEYTVAILDLERDVVEFLPVPAL